VSGGEKDAEKFAVELRSRKVREGKKLVEEMGFEFMVSRVKRAMLIS
jgi:hypothetical protein